jgi:hypothetical protein
MPSRLIDFGATTYGQNVANNSQLTESLTAKLVDGYINELKQFIKRPGLTQFSSNGASAIDGLYRTRSVSAGTILRVSGGVVRRVNSDGTETAFTGTSGLTSGTQVIFTEDKSFVYAAANSFICRINLTALTVASMTGGNAPSGVTYVAFSDNFLIANGSSGVAGDVFFSDDSINNYEASTSWEVYNNEAWGDSCNAVVVQWNEVYGFGPESLEVSFDDGVTPFARIEGATIPYGLAAQYSVVNVDNTLYYLSSIDGAIRLVKLEGRRPVLVSEPYDKYLQGVTTLSTARAFLLTIDAKPFYVVTFPGATNKTLAFNLRTRTWSEFGFYNGATYDQYLGQCSVYWPEQQKFLVGDRRANGKVHNLTGLTDDASLIRFELTSNVHRWGTFHRKRSDKLVFNTAGGNASLQFSESASSFPGTFYTIGTNYPFVNRLGVYRDRIYQIIHNDTLSTFVLQNAEEWFQVLRH